MADYGRGESLKSISNGETPKCRMERPETVVGLVQRFVDADQLRARKRAKVDGLVDGNAPLSGAKLKEQGRSDAANFNDGSGRGFLEGGAGALYDLTTEAPGVVQVTTSFGNEEQRVDWSRTLSKEADLVFVRDKAWDSNIQTSQTETVLHGTGPLFFDNPHVVLPRALPTGDLLVPDRASSDLDRWELTVILDELFPPELYRSIENENAAKTVGWNVEHTKLVIEHAIDQKQPDERNQNWEWFQNELKSNSFDYTDSVRVCRLAHVFWKEFSGRITHSIVERSDSTGDGAKYLFLHVGRYDNFYEIVNPMYFDKGRAGLHYNVTGLGVKMYGMMSYKNRLFLNLLDKAFAPKTLFKPTTAEAQVKFQQTRLGEYSILPPGVDVVQAPIQGFLTDGLAMHRQADDILRSNLSQYRQQVQPDQAGNPDTATEIRYKASQQSSLSNTVFSRYYKQLDALYAEIVRRLCNLNSTDKRAIEFQRRCIEQGVPRECFGRIENVVAVRVLGGGSPLLRRENIIAISSVIGRASEEGQNNWFNAFIAAHVGQSGVDLFNPHKRTSQLEGDQRERATNQIANAKIGIPPTMSPSQNPMIFAALFLQSGIAAVSSVQKGADPRQVVQFLDTIGPGIHAHLNRLASDPMRKQIATALFKQAQRLAKLTDQLKKVIQQQMAKQKQQRTKTQETMTDAQLKAMKAKSDMAIRTAKAQHGMAIKTATARQKLALDDARTASEIGLQHFRSLNE